MIASEHQVFLYKSHVKCNSASRSLEEIKTEVPKIRVFHKNTVHTLVVQLHWQERRASTSSINRRKAHLSYTFASRVSSAPCARNRSVKKGPQEQLQSGELRPRKTTGHSLQPHVP
jgi:hypothetical protein